MESKMESKMESIQSIPVPQWSRHGECRTSPVSILSLMRPRCVVCVCPRCPSIHHPHPRPSRVHPYVTPHANPNLATAVSLLTQNRSMHTVFFGLFSVAFHSLSNSLRSSTPTPPLSPILLRRYWLSCPSLFSPTASIDSRSSRFPPMPRTHPQHKHSRERRDIQYSIHYGCTLEVDHVELNGE